MKRTLILTFLASATVAHAQEPMQEVRVGAADPVAPKAASEVYTAQCGGRDYVATVKRRKTDVADVVVTVAMKAQHTPSKLRDRLGAFAEKRVAWGCYPGGALLTVTTLVRADEPGAAIARLRAYYTAGKTPSVSEIENLLKRP